METYEIPVADLLLDIKNPRHEPVSTQEQQIAALVKDDQVKNLAIDIAMNGISPIEKTIVLYDEASAKYIVLEGNRRVCALMLLHNPLLAPSNVRPAFNNMSKDKVPDTLECVLAETREQAQIWIERRHNGASGGIGLKTWNPTQKARASEVFSKPNENSLALALFEYAKKHLNLDCFEKKASLTTATRYLGNNKFRNTIGVRSRRTNKLVRIACSHSDFEKILYRFLFDLIENKATELGVNSRSKKLDIENYANHLAEEGLAPKITEKEVNLEPRPKGTSPWSTPVDSNDKSIQEEKKNNLSNEETLSESSHSTSQPGKYEEDERKDRDHSSLGTGNRPECEPYNANIDEDPADLSHLDISHTKSSNRLPASGKVIDRLVRLDNKKLSSLYKSICNIPSKQNASILYAGVWMFCEALATQQGKEATTGLDAFFNSVIKKAFHDRGTKKEQQGASDHITNYVNSIKHGGGYFASDAEQLAISMDTIEPTLLVMLDKLIEKKQILS